MYLCRSEQFIFCYTFVSLFSSALQRVQILTALYFPLFCFFFWNYWKMLYWSDLKYTLIFLRLDVGDGKEVDLEDCPRSRLREECIRYFGPVPKPNSEKPIRDQISLSHIKYPNFSLTLCDRLSWNKKEREFYEYIITEGTIVQKLTGNFLDTKRGLRSEKWIFVLSTCKKLYIGEVRPLEPHNTFVLVIS